MWPRGQTTVTGNLSIGNTTGDVFGAGWQIYTPSLSAAAGAFTSAVATGRYRLIDKTVQFQVTVRIVTNGSAANSVIVGLPLSPPASLSPYTSLGARHCDQWQGPVGPHSTKREHSGRDELRRQLPRRERRGAGH